MIIVYNSFSIVKSSICIQNMLDNLYTGNNIHYSIYILKDFSFVKYVTYKRIRNDIK